MSAHTHIAILGAGPDGYVAAIRAAQLGARVTVIESHILRGVCLNWGCIPSAADLIHEAALAMQLEATVTQLAELIHAHPTMAEGLMEAAEDAEGNAIHQIRKKAG